MFRDQSDFRSVSPLGMTESSRGWRQYGLVAGIATLAGVFLWRRFRSSGRDSATAGGDLGSVAVDDGVGSEAVDDEVVTERHAAAFLVRRRLDADGLDADALEGIVAEVRRRVAEDDPDWLLGVDAATTASLFLDRTAQPELVWYVEVPRSVTATWDDRRRCSPMRSPSTTTRYVRRRNRWTGR
ncbi:hypothetical protein D8S78_19080 [Natrialba swarupiae]|nr:hypothetical protein [Natrialba swarupiae]